MLSSNSLRGHPVRRIRFRAGGSGWITGPNQTKYSFDWIGQHWRGVAVLTAIAAASGWAVGRQHDNPMPVATPSALSDQKWSADRGQFTALAPVESRVQAYKPEHEAPASPDAESLAYALTVGTDNERFFALTTALQHDVELPPDVLIQAFENDPSDDVRLLAFSTYIDANSDDVELVRAALQRATNNTSSAVQAETHRRQTELTNYEAALAASPGQVMP